MYGALKFIILTINLNKIQTITNIMIKKIASKFRNNRDKLKDFGINSITGLFTGTTIGIFFNLTASVTFNRWIDPTNIGELFATVIYVSFIIFLLAFLYGLGIILTWMIDKNKVYSYHLNFIAGTYCSIMSFLLVLYHKQHLIRNTIAVIGIIVWIVVAYFTIKKEKPK